MATPSYLFDLPRIDDVVRRPRSQGAYDRVIVYDSVAERAVNGLVYGDSSAFERRERSFFEVRGLDGGGRMLRFERPTLGALVTHPRDRRIVERWVMLGTPLRALLISNRWGDHVVWDAPVRADSVEADSDGVSGLAVTLQQPGAGTEDPIREGGTIRRSSDLLAGVLDGLVLDGLSDDPSNALGLAHGFSARLGKTEVHTGEQRLAGSDGAEVYVETSRVLPAPGLTVAAEVFLSGPLGAILDSSFDADDIRAELAALTADGVVIASSTATPLDTAPAPAVPELTLPPSTWSVRIRVLVTGRGLETDVAVSSVRLLTVTPRLDVAALGLIYDEDGANLFDFDDAVLIG
ncbi:MAG: hypothetical protein AAF170_15100 [Bacteroidota bacterium]